MVRRFLLIICLVFLSALSLKAQYDGSFDAVFFNRFTDAKSESLGGIGKSIFNNSFSVHQNSSLLGFQDGYNVSYSYSSPYYVLDDGRFNYIGVSVKPFTKVALGISRYTFNSGVSIVQGLSSFALVYKINGKVSVSANVRELYVDMGDRTDEQGNFLGEGIAKQRYVDVAATGILPYSLSGADAKLISGITFENIFQQSMEYSFGEFSTNIGMPAIFTGSLNNELAWEGIDTILLPTNLYFNVASEYQAITNRASFKSHYSHYSLAEMFLFV